MFVTRGYKGHYIHVNAPDRGPEIIEAQIIKPDGGFDLIKCRTYAGAQRFISKHVEQERQRAVFAGTARDAGEASAEARS